MNAFFMDFHLIRPMWLMALLPLICLLWMMWRRRAQSRSWQRVVDAQLLQYVLIGNSGKCGIWTQVAVGLGGLLAIFALAGPAWRKLEQPVFQQRSALVVLLDLSRSMDAGDVKPSRLQRAQLKLRDILNQRKEGETALIVYAATPFVVSPLTTDANTIASQIDSLTTDLMPAQGARPDLAIGLAQNLLAQAGVDHGGVLLIGDGIGQADTGTLDKAVRQLVSAGHRLSVMGVGTSEGAPIPAPEGGFVKDASGAIALPRLDDAALAAAAAHGHGAYRRLATDDSDFQALLAPLNLSGAAQAKEVAGLRSDQWRDEGPWLLLPLVALAALSFRRGYLLVVFMLALPPAHPAYAADWSSLWQNSDQRGQQAMAAKRPELAAQLFVNPEWRAAANYRAGNYQASLDALQGIDSAQANYNRGNALAKLGRLPEAIKAYDQALKQDPGAEDARFNRDLVEKMMKQQPKQGKEQQQSDQQPQDDQPKEDKQQGGGKSPPPHDGKQEKQSAGNQPQSGQQQTGKEQAGQKPDQGKQAETKDGGKSSTGGSRQQGENGKSGAPNDAQMNNSNSPRPQDKTPDGQSSAAESDKQKQTRNADEQWLRQIPDDPGGLWRRKFLYQYSKQQQLQGSEK